MFLQNILLNLVFIILIIFSQVSVNILGQVHIGPLYECAHDLKGDVYVVNDRQILITGFNYDGYGPDASFHGQLRGSKGIYTTDIDMYVTLPYPDDECDRLEEGSTNANVTLILPRSIKDFETIGVFCYAFCHNFGHVHIPKELNVTDAPLDLRKTSECSNDDNNNNCELGRRSDNDLYPNCRGGNGESVGQNTTPEMEISTVKVILNSTTEVVGTTNGASKRLSFPTFFLILLLTFCSIQCSYICFLNF